jgi:ketosteroid isomerase-like protein
MSQENLEVVRSAFGAFEKGDLSFVDLWAEDATLTGPEGWPEKGPFHGREAIRGQFDRLTSDWSKSGFSDVEVVATEGDWVVMAFTWNAQGAASGLDLAVDMAAAYRFKDGAIHEGHFRWNRADVLDAAGLGSSRD